MGTRMKNPPLGRRQKAAAWKPRLVTVRVLHRRRIWIPDNLFAVSGMTAVANSHEPLRRAARPSNLRAEPQQQIAADDTLFPLDRRSRARLGARCAHRRTELPACQARPHSQPDRRTYRSSAVRTLLRLRRRPVGDRRADVAPDVCSANSLSANSLPPCGGGWEGGS